MFFTLSFCGAAEPEYKRTLGIGLAYNGGLVRWGFKKDWSVEAHYLYGSADSNDGNVSANVIGARGYRYFQISKSLRLFAGAEIGYVTTGSNNLHTTGYTGGGFAGLEFFILRRFSIGFDVGPYYTSLKEKSLDYSDSGVDFVGNSFLTWYVF